MLIIAGAIVCGVVIAVVVILVALRSLADAERAASALRDTDKGAP